ncbi:restriction endonuclease subunit S [Phormidium sp. LEGE 05292]|uniref:restriction endonuclease subunit S n=1 Tax=[Phormidium] sp. LEGE 05292 TaxID=767427 RepID=UPI00187F37DF|nr:restriction endonuclease subunit S [Phormidium sp. LEGE 05292]MBE9227297.1 restriction endonuclease subunit S [Phormidium sp. LEGE 05292]
MTIPYEIIALIEQLNNELNQIEREATEGRILARAILSRFPDNFSLIQLFATLNNHLVFVQISRRRIEYYGIILETGTATEQQVQEAGEDLSELLGRALDAKIVVNRIKTGLQEGL